LNESAKKAIGRLNRSQKFETNCHEFSQIRPAQPLRQTAGQAVLRYFDGVEIKRVGNGDKIGLWRWGETGAGDQIFFMCDFDRGGHYLMKRDDRRR
jgi:hypothetical protein